MRFNTTAAVGSLKKMKANKPGTDPLQFAIQSLLGLDIPAKGRIAHHIRTGRLERAIGLCAAGQLFLWKRIWINAGRPTLFDQLAKLKQVERLLRIQAGYSAAAF